MAHSVVGVRKHPYTYFSVRVHPPFTVGYINGEFNCHCLLGKTWWSDAYDYWLVWQK